MQISQIFLSQGNYPLPPLLKSATEAARANLPESEYKLYDLPAIRDFITSNFESDVINAFDCLRPFAYKADLARYCLAWQVGGWYVDISILVVKSINPIPADVDMLYFYDNGDGFFPGRIGYGVQTSFFFTRPFNPVFKKAIELVIEHCRIEYYGQSPVCPTGPAVFGRSIAFAGIQDSHAVGDFMPLTPNHRQNNRSYVMHDGAIVALHKNAWHPDAEAGELSSFGAKGTNSYPEMWRNKEIYDATRVKLLKRT
jgi:mannosyltransferase OCH1-like enzyme